MSAALSYARVRENLEHLAMSASLAALDSVLERGQKEEKLVVEVLDELLQIERSARFERRIQTNLRLAGLPARTSLDSFDFTAAPDVPRKTLEELMTLRFLHQGENILFLGPCGVGKTHLATALALQAIESGHRVYFLTLHDLALKARKERARDRLEDLMRHLVRPELLILDEIGYLPLSQEDATFLFEVVNKRYQQARSIILTSNKSFGRWDEFFPDPVLATALLDRLLHHATTVNIRGESYRLRHRRNAGLTDPSSPGKEPTP
ncbi:MAG TPA: IS21-like element helper ATPase IstB [Gemmataceae bacterium]|jgi:DNA replication protein DnaC